METYISMLSDLASIKKEVTAKNKIEYEYDLKRQEHLKTFIKDYDTCRQMIYDLDSLLDVFRKERQAELEKNEIEIKNY